VRNRRVHLSRRVAESRASGLQTAPNLVRRRTYTITEVAVILGIGRSTAYALAQRGEIRALRVGGRVVVPVDEVERLLAGDDAA
jgi:excisionase family DNA binding protein